MIQSLPLLRDPRTALGMNHPVTSALCIEAGVGTGCLGQERGRGESGGSVTQKYLKQKNKTEKNMTTMLNEMMDKVSGKQ